MASESYTTSETVAARIGDALTGLFGEACPRAPCSPSQSNTETTSSSLRSPGSGPVASGLAPAKGQGQGEESGSGEGGGGGGFARTSGSGDQGHADWRGGDAGDRLHQDRRHAAPGIARGLASPQPLRSSPPLAAQDSTRTPGIGIDDQGRHVDGLECRSGDRLELSQHVVVPSGIGAAGDVPGRAVVGEDQTVLLEGPSG